MEKLITNKALEERKENVYYKLENLRLDLHAAYARTETNERIFDKEGNERLFDADKNRGLADRLEENKKIYYYAENVGMYYWPLEEGEWEDEAELEIQVAEAEQYLKSYGDIIQLELACEEAKLYEAYKFQEEWEDQCGLKSREWEVKRQEVLSKITPAMKEAEKQSNIRRFPNEKNWDFSNL